jgi:hypothetical protein
MADEFASVTFTVNRTNRDLPRRDPQQQDSRRRPPKHSPPAADPAVSAAVPGDEAPTVGSHLNVRA